VYGYGYEDEDERWLAMTMGREERGGINGIWGQRLSLSIPAGPNSG
jgi:hypothetical protein